ncbi:M20 metallopeptidase family protein [Microbacterium gorillae]|uniref:M20 metallopeptidase family protein n=1 Tax=Microbacterium gorillae TaxID=1231063 RepID=UPI003D9680F8
MLIGAARLLSARVAELEGDVVFAFQPGEENWGGAKVMLSEGLLDAAGVPICAALGIHVFAADFVSGTFSFRPALVISAPTAFDVTFRGAGRYGSSPQKAVDPIPAAASFVTSPYTASTRTFGMHDQAVVTIGHLAAGDVGNVIPTTATIRGTARSVDRSLQERMRRLIDRVADGVARAHGVEVDVDLEDVTLPVISDDEETAFAMRIVADACGEDRVALLPLPSPASDDFSWILDEFPGVFAFLGAGVSDDHEGQEPDNHSPNVRFDDSVVTIGAWFEAEWALKRLRYRPPLATMPAAAARLSVR